jgi:hypothetical protein
MTAMMKQMEKEMPWPTDPKVIESARRFKREIEERRRQRMKEPADDD